MDSFIGVVEFLNQFWDIDIQGIVQSLDHFLVNLGEACQVVGLQYFSETINIWKVTCW